MDKENTSARKRARYAGRKLPFDISSVITDRILLIVSVAVLLTVLFAVRHAHAAQLEAESGNVYSRDTVALDLFTEDDPTLSEDMSREEAATKIAPPSSSTFDSSGRLSSEVICDPDTGAVSAVNCYGYSSSGDVLLIKSYGGDGILTSKTVFNEGEKKVFSPVTDSSGEYSGYTADIYDAYDTVITRENYNSNGVKESYVRFEYGENGAVSKETHYSSFDAVTNVTAYGYDENGNEVEKSQYTADGVLVVKDTAVFDEFSRPIRREHYSGSVLFSFDEYEYDAFGNASKFTSTRISENSNRFERRQVVVD